MADSKRPESPLERRILEAILEFPERIDEMETRNEESCRKLAAQLAALVEAESHPRPGKR